MVARIRIRKVILRDKLDILDWRNDSDSRKNSLDSTIVKVKDHNIWFEKIVNDKRFNNFIALSEKSKIGFVSYKKKQSRDLITSLNINPKFRGKGYGHKILLLSAKLMTSKGFNGEFFAKIKKNNLPSINTFKKAHYAKKRIHSDYLLFSYDAKNWESKIMKDNNKNTYGKIIDQIEDIRSKNNTNWMDILRIAFKHSPKEAAKVMSQIYKEDQKISKLAKKLEK